MTRGKKRATYHHGDLRPALLAAAVAEIADKGPSGLSLRECARRAGVSHAAPYRHFVDKNALLLAIAREGFERLTAAGVAAMEGLGDPRARIDAYGVAYVRFAIENPVHFRVMFTGVRSQPDAQAQAQAAADSALGLLMRAAEAVVGPEAAELAGIASWTIPHGLAMLMLDGRMPPEHTVDADAAGALAEQIYAQWRGPLQ